MHFLTCAKRFGESVCGFRPWWGGAKSNRELWLRAPCYTQTKNEKARASQNQSECFYGSVWHAHIPRGDHHKQQTRLRLPYSCVCVEFNWAGRFGVSWIVFFLASSAGCWVGRGANRDSGRGTRRNNKGLRGATPAVVASRCDTHGVCDSSLNAPWVLAGVLSHTHRPQRKNDNEGAFVVGRRPRKIQDLLQFFFCFFSCPSRARAGARTMRLRGDVSSGSERTHQRHTFTRWWVGANARRNQNRTMLRNVEWGEERQPQRDEERGRKTLSRNHKKNGCLCAAKGPKRNDNSH